MTDKKTTTLPATEFLPDFDSYEGLAVTNEYAYYLGVIPTCPVTQINCVGLNFPMAQEVRRADPMRPGQKKFVPVTGGMHKKINVDHIHALRDALKRMVIRFLDEPEQHEERGTGVNIGASHRRARRGKIVKIPTPERVAEARENGTHVPRYVRQPNDEPAAKYMYFKLCPNQDKPERGHDFTTIEQEGIVWPDELIAETEAFLA